MFNLVKGFMRHETKDNNSSSMTDQNHVKDDSGMDDPISDQTQIPSKQSTKSSIYYFDDNGSLVSEDKAVRFISRTVDENGNLIFEGWGVFEDNVTHTDRSAFFHDTDTDKNAQIRLLICTTGEILTFKKSTVLIGRSRDECDGIIESHSVSRRHLMIRKKKNGMVGLMDLDSVNGTFVDGIRIPSKEEVEIKPDKVFKVADIELKIFP